MRRLVPILLLPLFAAVASAQSAPSVAPDTALARRVGADERGMRRYVLVVLTTGPRRVPDGPERQAMFQGHFANMERLAGEGKLVVAGPFDPGTTWRGLFVFAVETVAEAEALVATDPVIQTGEMVAEYHPLYASAALMLVNEMHARLAPR